MRALEKVEKQISLANEHKISREALLKQSVIIMDHSRIWIVNRYQAIRRSVEKFDNKQSSFTRWINTAKGPCTTYRVPRVVFIFPEFKLVDFKHDPWSPNLYIYQIYTCAYKHS
ncbi:hypothetical protein RF11_12406 [Thelohanellus kitauei]|uniref:Uncharacterized protein n=1 Tax=Thelohanellus kitauei TaxID=669202 RepID=A0A0C2M6P4_THEKT|nr:hypothetical protein RF11_12406 [Thelohanellus kitauei]